MDITVISNRAAVVAATEGAIRKALEICGGKAETYAKMNCPVDTGRLRSSITHQADGYDTMLVGSNVEYAPYVELGHHQEPGRYVAAIGKRLVADWVPPKPYLRPAFEDHMAEYQGILHDDLTKI